MAFLNSTPRWAPSPVPTMIAVGVARPERVRAGDHHHGDGEQHGVAERPTGQQPCHQGERRRRPGRPGPARTRPGRPAAGRGPWSSGPPGRARRSGPGRCRRRPWWPAPAGCRCVLMVAPMTSSPGCLWHRQALAGDHRLVDLALAVLDDAVDGDLGARADQQQVPDRDLGGGDLDRLAVAQHHAPWAGRGPAGCGWRRWRRRGRASRTSGRAARTRRARWPPRRTPRRRRSG